MPKERQLMSLKCYHIPGIVIRARKQCIGNNKKKKKEEVSEIKLKNKSYLTQNFQNTITKHIRKE